MKLAVFSWASLAALLFACGGSSSGDSFTGDDGGSAGDDSSTSNGDGGVGGEGGGPTSDGSTGGGDGGAIGPDGGIIPPATSGITITVEPDGTGDAAGLLSAIQGAQTAVHVEMYLLTNTKYIAALIALGQAGKNVEVVLNQTFPSGTSAANTNASSYAQLNAAGTGVTAHWAPTTTGFDSYTHEKTVIIDPAGGADSQAWIMTMNLDTSAPRYNREFLAQDTNAADIAEAEAIFQADYASTSITPTGNLVVAPSPQNNAVSVLVGLINSATTSIDMEAEEFDDSGTQTEAKVFAALGAKAKAGVAVHLVLEDSTSSEQTSAVATLQQDTGVVVGYACNASLDIHAKAIVVDGARAYVGSENFSGGSLGYNRELGVYFTEASEVAKVDSTIKADFAAGTTYSATCN